jgi:hypothetical protein
VANSQALSSLASGDFSLTTKKRKGILLKQRVLYGRWIFNMSGRKQSGTRHLKGGYGPLHTINKPFYRVIALPPAGRVLPLRSLLVCSVASRARHLRLISDVCPGVANRRNTNRLHQEIIKKIILAFGPYNRLMRPREASRGLTWVI